MHTGFGGGPRGFGHGDGRGGARGGGRHAVAGAETTASDRKGGFFTLLIETWPFVRPHRKLLLIGFVLMAINRLAGLVLPGSVKFLVDNVLGKHQTQLLVPLVGAVLAATAVQG